MPAGCVVIALLTAAAATPPRATTSEPTPAQVEKWFRDYMAAVNAHDVRRSQAFLAKDVAFRGDGEPLSLADLRARREWEVPMQARFDYEVYAVNGEWLTATIEEANLLDNALDVRRTTVAEYRFRDRRILECNLRWARDAGRPREEARAEIEEWLGRQPSARTAGVLANRRLAFTGEAGRKLLPLLEEWRRSVAASRVRHEAVVRGFVDAMNRSDVDAQYALYGEDMAYVDGGRRIDPDREKERRDREFEKGSSVIWSFEVLGAGPLTLDVRLTEELAYYRALGAGARSSRRSMRFRDGRIALMRASDWAQGGRPYEGARDAFKAWLARERPEAAAALVRGDRLVFDGTTARALTDLAREWRATHPCTLEHPSYSPREPRIAFSSNCEGKWNVYVMDADGAYPVRLTDNVADARRPTWSLDGRRVVFETDGDGNGHLYQVALDGSGLTRLSPQPGGQLARNEVNDGGPARSPDGSRIVFLSGMKNVDDVYSSKADGTDLRRLTHWTANEATR